MGRFTGKGPAKAGVNETRVGVGKVTQAKGSNKAAPKVASADRRVTGSRMTGRMSLGAAQRIGNATTPLGSEHRYLPPEHGEVQNSRLESYVPAGLIDSRYARQAEPVITKRAPDTLVDFGDGKGPATFGVSGLPAQHKL